MMNKVRSVTLPKVECGRLLIDAMKPLFLRDQRKQALSSVVPQNKN